MKAETAKDLLKQILNTDLTLQYREKLIIEYAELKCSEQRSICQQIFEYTIAQKGNIYVNAPKPDLT